MFPVSHFPLLRFLFAARLYASVVFAVVVCPSVRLSVRPSQLAGVVSKRLDEPKLLFGMEAFLPIV